MNKIIVLGPALILSACAAMPMPEPAQPQIVYPVSQESSPGAIGAPGEGLFLFEDAKSRNIGDLVTILLVERTTAQKSATTSTSKDDSLGIGAATLFGHGINSDSSVDVNRAFDGKGDSSQSNKLEGKLTVSVIQRLPNGNLVIRGEKQLQLNQGMEFVRLEGVVRPADIGPDNTVTSDRIANARVSYAGRGALADSNAQGWLSRFFSSPWMPF